LGSSADHALVDGIELPGLHDVFLIFSIFRRFLVNQQRPLL
jgi:hypothetical protein